MKYTAIASITAAVALVIAGVDWTDSGTAQQQARVDVQLPARSSHSNTKHAVERSSADERVDGRLERPNVIAPRMDALRADDTSTVRAAGARELAMENLTAFVDVPGQHAEAILATTALSHAEVGVREEAVHALGERGGAVAMQTLHQALQDPSTRVREEAVRALVEIGGNEALAVLASLLSSSEVSVRVEAVDAIGQIGGRDAARRLQPMLQDESDVVREAAADWLDELPAV